MGFIRLLLTEQNVKMQYEIVIMLFLLMFPLFIIKDRRKIYSLWTAVFIFFVYIHRVLLPFLLSGIYFYLVLGILGIIIFLKPAAFFYPAKWTRDRLLAYTADGMLPFAAIIVLILMIQLCRLNISLDYDSLRYGLRSDVLLTEDGIPGFFRSIGLVNTVYTYPKGFELLTLPLTNDTTYGYVLCFNVWALIACILVCGDMTAVILGGRASGIFAPAGAVASAAVSLIPGITNMSITAKSDLITLLCQLVFLLCVLSYLQKPDRSLTGIGTGALVLSYAFKPTSLIFSSVTGLAAAVFFAVRHIRPCFNFCSVRALLGSLLFTFIITARTFFITGQPFTSIFTGLFSRLGFELKYPFRAQEITAVSESTTLENLKLFFSRLAHFLFCPTGEDMEHVQMAWGGIVFVLLLIAALLLIKRTVSTLDELLRLEAIRNGGYGSDSSGNVAHETARADNPAAGAAGSRQNASAADNANAGGGTASISDTHTDPIYQGVPGAKNPKSGTLFPVEASPAAGYCDSQDETLAACFGYTALIAVMVMSLISLALLSQVDGNYFELLYALSAVMGCAALLTRLRLEQSELYKHQRKWLDGGSPAAILVISAAMVYFTAFTSWAGANGFTPADFINRGYYNHAAECGIKNPLGWDRHTRIVAFAAEPECYFLKGRVESWVDIDGSGGNVYLTDTKLDIFKEYLAWADIDYIYADVTFLNDDTNERHIRAKTLFGYLVEDAVFEDVVLETGSSRLLYCRIDKERVSVSWEVPMSEEELGRVSGQLEYLEGVIEFGD